ncbi:MAG: D-alanyl-D-alanine carboxypeptidase [Clostridia bacterium]|nr:D-alanyl-D-alanine carboxypeptidase [Clostridia bacterium]
MKFKRLFFYILMFMLVIMPTYSFANQANANTNSSYVFVEEQDNEVQYAIVEKEDEEVQIDSEAAILIDSSTGKVLYSKNSSQKMYPASTTKILTAIIAIEKANLQDKAIVNKSAISIIPSGYSSAYLSEGEDITVEQLLQVFLIHSANEAGNVLAEHVSGSMDEFVKLMNEKASELGCKNTHFVNTNGIHNENHYTTAEDLATIARYCMKNQTFRNIVSMKKCVIPKTNKSDTREYKNTNALIDTESKNYLPDCIGIKTGFTSEARNCLVSACNKNGLELISVILGSPTLKSGESTRYKDSINLYNYGYSNYAMKKIASKDNIVYTIDIKNGNKETKTVDLKIADDISALVNTQNENITYAINLKDNLAAPIATNSVVGTITYAVDDISYTENLLSSHDVVKKNTIIYLYGMLGILILVILLISLLLKRKKNPKRSKKYSGRH